MMYLAPRQGLFAIIVLVSFCLQTLLLVISTDQQLSKSREQKGEQMVAQLIDEARLSLENKDRVSLSVIANRYTSEQDVARLVIKDSNDDILVPVGNAPMQQGKTISQIATQGDAVIGTVALTLKDLSKGEIITMQWPFVIGSLFLHLILWLLYGYIARPTKEQINALSRDIHNLHREHATQAQQLSYGRQAADSERLDSGTTNNSNNAVHNSTDDSNQAHDKTHVTANNRRKATIDKSATTGAIVNTSSIHGDVNAYLKAQQSGTDANGQADLQPADNATASSTVGLEDNNSVPAQAPSNHKTTNSNSKLSALRSFDSVSVQFMLHDEYNMLERLAPETRQPYLALCTQLLNQALIELLKQPLLLGVSAVNEPRFDDNGACAVLIKADNSHAKVALAGVMLGKLYLMLNKIIHDKHIELKSFALSAKAGVSDSAQTDAMTNLLNGVGRKEQLLILLPNAGLKQIGNHMQVHSLKRPTTVYERECAVFDGGNEAMIKRLAEVRNAVLMNENEDE